VTKFATGAWTGGWHKSWDVDEGSYNDGYRNAGEDALELRELEGPLAWKGGAVERRDLEDEPVEMLLPETPLRRPSFLSFVLVIWPDRSLSVAGVVTEPSSISPELLPSVDAEPETKLNDDELLLRSFPFSLSFSSKPMKIRDLASLYAASRSSIVMYFLLPLPPVALLRPPRLPVSEGSASERSASSPATEPACECVLDRLRSWVRRMILNAG